MKRRQLLIMSGVCGLVPAGLGPAGVAMGAAAAGAGAAKDYYELRRYRMIAGKEALLENFVRDAAVPAWNRAGVKPVGVFKETEGEARTLYALLPHKTLESVASLESRLAADAEYQKAGAEFLNAPNKEPAFERIESALMAAFDGMPQLAAPPQTPGRIFELRTYESPSAKAGWKKIEMFNDGGEIGIFHKSGMRPVFFGQTLIGALLPNLTYMLAFGDMAEHDRVWDAFKNAPEWKALQSKPEYKAIVSHITRTFLQPLPCSQI